MAVVEACFAASAFFFASRARQFRLASLLPEATRPGFFSVAGFVYGGSAVTRAGGVACAGAVVSSGIVSSGCVAIVYKGVLKIYNPTRFLPESFKHPARFLQDSCQLSQLHQRPRVDSLRRLCWVAWEAGLVQKSSSLVA